MRAIPLTIAGALLSCQAVAVPVNFGGHWYDVVFVEGISWTDARTAALNTSNATSSSWDLATVGSAAENSFIESLLSTSLADRSHFWIGGYETDPNTEGSWGWVDGTVWSFTDWHGGGEPNDAQGVEDYLAYDLRDATWAWNDAPNDIEDVFGGAYVRGYVIEAVPVPAAAILFGSALMGLTMVARRRKPKQAA